MNQSKIAVLGGGGRTGTHVVDELLIKDYSVRMLLRNTDDFFQRDLAKIQIVKGDALDPAAIDLLVAGCDAIISTIGQRIGEPLVASHATRLILDAMATHGISRYILVAGVNVDTPADKKDVKTQAATEWMKTNYGAIHADRQEAFRLLNESEMNWTMIRVPLIAFVDDKDEIDVCLETCHGDRISAASIAEFVVKQLSDDRFHKMSPFIAATAH